MKQTTKHGQSVARRICSTLLACTLFFSYHPVHAAIIPASNPDKFVAAGVDARNVNCDMIEHTSGNLRAIAYDDFNTGNGYVTLEDNSGGTLTIPILGGLHPDVVIGDDASNPGVDYIVAVVYGTGTIYFDTYTIAGVGGGTLTVAASNIGNQVSATVGQSQESAHIDLYPDVPAAPIAGRPALYDFVITWAERPSPTNVNVSAITGALATPALFTKYTFSTTGIYPDVACLWDLSTSEPFAYVAFQNIVNGLLDLAEINLATSTVTVTTGISVSVLKGGPRIEAMNQYDPGSGYAQYEIAYAATNLPGGIQIWGYNNIAGNVNISAAGYAGTHNVHPAVAAGVGSISGMAGYCNENYTIGWKNTTSLFYNTATVDMITGAISTAYPDYYEVNLKTIPGFAYYYSPLAVSSSSNSGMDLLTAWSDGDDSVWFKYTGDVTSYKTTGVNEVEKEVYGLYPNPAGKYINILATSNAAYSLSDMTGRILMQGQLQKGDNNADISDFTPGIYMVTIRANGQNRVFRFTKQ